MNFLNLFKRLLPSSKAWSLIADKMLRSFFESLSVSLGNATKLYLDQIYLDLFPATTREFEAWDLQFGLPPNVELTEEEKRTRLDGAWKAQGGQSPRYIQDTLQNAGFDIYVHEWWVPDSDPPIARNPLALVSPTGIGCGEPLAQCGEPDMQCGNALSIAGGEVLVNKLYVADKIGLTDCGEPTAQCGEPSMQCGNYSGYDFRRVEYEIPTNPDFWPYFVYLCGETFGDFGVIQSGRKAELEDLALKIIPEQLWIILKVFESGFFCQSNQSGGPGTVDIKFNITGGGEVTIGWGDGDSDVLSGDTTASHTYTGTSIYDISIEGDLDLITDIEFTTGRTTIIGDIANIIQFEILEILILTDTHFFGNVGGLANIGTLEHIFVDQTDVSGSIAPLNILSALVKFYADNTNVGGNLESFSGMTQLTHFSVNNSIVEGDIDDIDSYTNLVVLGLGGTDVVGTIDVLTSNTGLAYLYLYDLAGVNGSIFYLNAMPLVELYVYNTGITGSLGEFISTTTMVKFYGYDTAIAGNIANLAALTSLTHLDLHTSSVTGDVEDVNTLVNIVLLGLYDLSLSFGDPEETPTLPAWTDATIKVNDNTFDAGEVDRFITALDTAGGTDGYLDIDGTNASKTPASSDELDSLIAKGWTVLVNETAPFVQSDQTGGAGTIGITISLQSGKLCTIAWGDSDTSEITGTGSPVLYEHTYVDDEVFELDIIGDYDNITSMVFGTGKETIFNNISTFDKMWDLEILGCNGTLISGDVNGLPNLTAIEEIYLNGTAVTGTIDPFEDMTNLTVLHANDTALSGALSLIDGLTSLTSLDLGETSVSGTIVSLNGMTSLTYLDISSTTVAGAVTGVPALTSLLYLYVDNTSITGLVSEFVMATGLIELVANDCAGLSCDIDDLDVLTDLELLNIENIPSWYLTTTLPTWSDIVFIATSCSLTTAQVDQILIDLNTAGGTGGTLYIAGTNDARSSTSDAAHTALLGKSWTIYVNEIAEFLDINHPDEYFLTMRIELPVGKSIEIYWGDGDSDTHNGTGAPETENHTYNGIDTDTINILGDLDEVVEIGFENDLTVEGDIDAFTLFPNLERLYATGCTNIDGNLSGIDSLTSIEELWADDTGVTGSVDSLDAMTGMTHIHLDNTVVTGSLADLTSMSGLIDLWANNTSITGSISNLAALTSMEDIGLDETTVSGALSNLSSLTSLIKVQLGNTSCTGDIDEFASVTTLTHMHLYDQPFTGSTADLTSLTNLIDLRLNNTSVTGSISNVQSLTSLTYLDLSDTSISGDIDYFDGLTSLLTLKFFNTAVSGDVEDLNTLTVIEVLDASDNSLSIDTFGELAPWDDATLDFSDQAWDAFDVDDFLEQLDDADGDDGWLDISGSNASPSGIGDFYIDNLEGKGWTIIYN